VGSGDSRSARWAWFRPRSGRRQPGWPVARGLALGRLGGRLVRPRRSRRNAWHPPARPSSRSESRPARPGPAPEDRRDHGLSAVSNARRSLSAGIPTTWVHGLLLSQRQQTVHPCRWRPVRGARSPLAGPAATMQASLMSCLPLWPHWPRRARPVSMITVAACPPRPHIHRDHGASLGPGPLGAAGGVGGPSGVGSAGDSGGVGAGGAGGGVSRGAGGEVLRGGW
jgi:hypothetical protein